VTVIEYLRKEKLLIPAEWLPEHLTKGEKYSGCYLGVAYVPHKVGGRLDDSRVKVRCASVRFSVNDVPMQDRVITGVLTSEPYGTDLYTVGFQPDDPSLQVSGGLWYGYVHSFTPALKPRKQKT